MTHDTSRSRSLPSQHVTILGSGSGSGTSGSGSGTISTTTRLAPHGSS